MDNIMQSITGWIIPVIMVLAGLSFLVALKVAASRYKKVPPGRVGIFYGMKYKDGKGFMIMSGGGRVQRPLVEGYIEIPTTAFQVEINESGIPNKDNVKLTVPGVATCKISTNPENLNKAIDALIDKLTQENGPKRGVTDANPIEEFVRNILKGHLRSIIGKLDINELLRNRDEFNKKVVEESAAELAGFGIELMNLVIQDIRDDQGYIDALGKRAVADAKAEAEIKTAEALREQNIKVSNAQREASIVQAENEAKIADANKERDLKKAGFLKETATAQAEADMAGQIATTAQEQKLKVAQAERDKAERTAQVGVQQEELKRKEAELNATIVATATATKKKTVIDAEADKERQVLQAQATAEVLKTTAQAKKDATTLEGQGEAAATEAKLIAQAKGAAAGERETLVARAEGTKQLNEALAKMSDAAKLILILDRLPLLLEKGGDAGSKMLTSMFGPVAAGLANIDRISIVDMGGNGDGINKMSNIVPNAVFNVLAQLKAKGIDLKSLASMVGLNLDGLDSLLAGVAPDTSNTETSTKGEGAHS